jgi:hypothetical protein
MQFFIEFIDNEQKLEECDRAGDDVYNLHI